MDMQPLYEARAADDRIEFEPSDVIGTASVDTTLPPPVVWDYMSSLEFRKVLLGSDRQEVADLKNGLVAAGSTYQCFHGDKSYSQVVLEWTPFERVVVEQTLEVPGGPTTMLLDYRLTPIDGGTQLTSTAARIGGRGWRRLAWKSMVKVGAKKSQVALIRFRDHIEADSEQRAGQSVAPTIDKASIAASAANGVSAWNSGSSAVGEAREPGEQ
jgi:hypothetical protein